MTADGRKGNKVQRPRSSNYTLLATGAKTNVQEATAIVCQGEGVSDKGNRVF